MIDRLWRGWKTEPSRQSPPVELQAASSAHTEFVVCDCTIEEAPEDATYKLRLKAPRIYEWLLRNDKEWFDAHHQDKRKPSDDQSSRILQSSKKKKKVQVTIEYDRALAETIRTTASELRNTAERPIRVSIRRICREIPQLRYVPRSDVTSLAVQTLQEVAETHVDFALRKIKWALQKYLEEQICPKRYQFIERISLKKKILQNPVVQYAFEEAMMILLNKGL